ncbi:bifunctional diaminohydroxyphosphoribosylaminopyrimidine deaminase/5-amino-6-(5-phosphoribosylamino)uracil reductase RibD [Alkalicoccobacillus porphyridii]|nr:bifunctional diaminohydroxyphosphoribosylaminopyrimidine deaminase/5-amino-6-(5-phosphoribosylamino)uracil reductase RibD [Alkalicoccobacillus porphyridii]
MDQEYMKLALTLAESAKGQTAPNPMVGAVIVKDGRIVGTGAHLKAGQAHAEVHALKMAGDEANGATMYVTLEPCSHFGRTPPCAKQVITSGVKRVVIAVVDQNPKVAGKGVAMLREAGIEVEVGMCEQEAKELNRAFFHFIKSHQPYVTLKAALTLDGKTATVKGESQWITGPEARLDGHIMRHEHDAILVGIGTVLADNPSLTARLQNGEGRHPTRVILDSHLRIPLNATIVNDQKADTIIFTTNTAPEKHELLLAKPRVHIISLEQLTISNVLQELGKLEIVTLLVEGGARVHGSFVKEHAVHELVQYIAPKLIGGTHATPVIGGEGIARLDQALNLSIVSVNKVGEDLRILSKVRSE